MDEVTGSTSTHMVDGNDLRGPPLPLELLVELEHWAFLVGGPKISSATAAGQILVLLAGC